MPKKEQKVFFDVIIVYILHFKHDDFIEKKMFDFMMKRYVSNVNKRVK